MIVGKYLSWIFKVDKFFFLLLLDVLNHLIISSSIKIGVLIIKHSHLKIGEYTLVLWIIYEMTNTNNTTLKVVRNFKQRIPCESAPVKFQVEF